MEKRTQGTIEMSVAMLILGTIGWFVVVSERPPHDVVFWRCLFGAATLLAVCAGRGLLRHGLPLRTLGLAALGGAAIVTNWLLLFAAFPRASISVATAVYNTQPFMLVALGALLFGERLTGMGLAWLGAAFVGVLLVVQARPDAGYVGPGFLVGVLLALGAAFLYALAAIVAKKLDGTPPHLIALVQVGVGVLLLAPFADFSDLPTGARSWGALLALGVVHTGLMYILLYGAIQKLPTRLTGSLTFIYPVAAIAVDALAFGHRLQPGQLLGAAIILVAAAGMNRGWGGARAGTAPAPTPPLSRRCDRGAG